jgi:hypothetical protein
LSSGILLVKCQPTARDTARSVSLCTLVAAGFSLFSRRTTSPTIGMLKLSVQFIMGKFELGPANESQRNLSRTSQRPLCATSGLMHRSKPHPYPITSSARPSSVGGMVKPSEVAVFIFITVRNYVGCLTIRREFVA